MELSEDSLAYFLACGYSKESSSSRVTTFEAKLNYDYISWKSDQ